MRDAVAEGVQPFTEFLHVVVLILSFGDCNWWLVGRGNRDFADYADWGTGKPQISPISQRGPD